MQQKCLPIFEIKFQNEKDNRNKRNVGGEKTRRIGIALLVTALALLPVFAAAPALAAQPKLTYVFGAVSLGVPNTGTIFTSGDKMEHVRDVQGIAYDFGHPWGPGVGTLEDSFNLNVDPESSGFLTGNMVANLETTYTTGILKMIDVGRYSGFGQYVYEGPAFTVTLPGYGSITMSYGQSFYGALTEAFAVGHGIFTNRGVIVTEITNGVMILDGSYAGLIILHGIGVYAYKR